MIHKMFHTMKPSKPPREWEGVGEAGGRGLSSKGKVRAKRGGGVREANGAYYVWSILLSIYFHRQDRKTGNPKSPKLTIYIC